MNKPLTSKQVEVAARRRFLEEKIAWVQNNRKNADGQWEPRRWYPLTKKQAKEEIARNNW